MKGLLCTVSNKFIDYFVITNLNYIENVSAKNRQLEDDLLLVASNGHHNQSVEFFKVMQTF